MRSRAYIEHRKLWRVKYSQVITLYQFYRVKILRFLGNKLLFRSMLVILTYWIVPRISVKKT